MAFSINNRLTIFAREELVIHYDSTERTNIQVSIEQLERILKYKLADEWKGSLKFGSLTRNTILPRKYDPHSDVDLMVIFNTDSNRYNPLWYREKLRRIISTAYPNSISQKDFPAVKLELYHIMFDVVPAYTQDFWGTTYFIPDGQNAWTSTVPNDINNRLEQMNQSYGDNIVRQVLRLCKYWNASNNYPFESYLMEKQIVEMFFWWGDNLFEKFLSVLRNLAGNRTGVSQALYWIERYGREGNELKQFEWLQRLLPGLK